MGVVYLVRHGQASFGAVNYDQLSPLGEQQARALGTALRGKLDRVDRVLAGSLVRHAQTARHCLDAFGAAPVEIEVDPRWNEFDHEELLLRHEPDFADRPRVYAKLAAAEDPQAAFEALFRGAVARWTGGAFDHEYAESWAAFRARCVAALDDLVAALGPSKTALVFTSGGPIASIVARDLSLSDAAALDLPVRLANCGLTKMVYGSRGTRLSVLNEHGWLEGDGRRLLSYR
jgi:broad specificity phosphatase PhoE